MGIEIPKPLKPISDFSVQIVVGGVAFLVVYGAAGLLSCAVKLMDGIVPSWVAWAGGWAEKLLFGADLLCFALFIAAEVIKLVRALVKGVIEDW